MRKGLFIGINHYQHVAPLSGCNNDAMAMASVLERHANGRPNFSSKVLTSSEENLTLNTLKQQIQSLFSGDCDVALLYFAGHGQFDTSIDEGLLIPQDFKHGGKAFASATFCCGLIRRRRSKTKSSSSIAARPARPLPCAVCAAVAV